MAGGERHTPGPWALQMAEDCQGRQLDEMVKWVVTANANDLWISTGPTWDAEHDAEALANARLIAAAPELLEALVEVLDALGFIGGGDHELEWHGIPAERAAEIRALLAKATGAAP